MTPEIERLAKEAGINIDPRWGVISTSNVRLAKFAALVAEACVKEADGQAYLHQAIKAIRAKFALSGGEDEAK